MFAACPTAGAVTNGVGAGKDVTIAVGTFVGFVVGVATIVERAKTVGVEIGVDVAEAEHAEIQTATRNKRIIRETIFPVASGCGKLRHCGIMPLSEDSWPKTLKLLVLLI